MGLQMSLVPCPEVILSRHTSMPRDEIKRQRSKRCFLIKSEFAFFQTFTRLLQVAYFVKCRRNPNPSSEGEKVHHSQGHPTTIFGKYLFGRRFEI